jgi:hypothetical protein
VSTPCAELFLNRRTLLLAGLASSLSACATAPERPDISRGTLGIPDVPDIDLFITANISLDSNVHFASGENSGAAGRMQRAMGSNYRSYCDRLISEIRRAFLQRNVQVATVPFTRIDTFFKTPYPNTEHDYVLLCIPSVAFDRTTLVRPSVHTTLIDTKKTVEVHTQYFGLGVRDSPFGRRIGFAIESAEPWYPKPGDPDLLFKKLNAVIPLLSNGIANHYLGTIS